MRFPFKGICSRSIPSGRKYLGIEPSEPLVLRAAELYGKEDRGFVAGNAYKLPLPDAACAGAFSVNVWMHLSNLQQAAQELSRVLVAGGRFLIITANPGGYDDWEQMHFNTTRTAYKITGGFHLPDDVDLPEHVLFTHSLNDILNSLTQAGLEILCNETFGQDTANGENNWFIALQGLKRCLS